MSEEVIQSQTTPATEGVPTPETQATSTPETGAGSQEEASTKVDSGDNAPSNQEQTRRPSDYWAGRQIKKMERQLAQLQNELREARAPRNEPSAPSQPAQPNIDPNLYWKNPFEYLAKMQQQIREDVEKTYSAREEARILDSGRKEARDLILKNDLVKKDPQWKERFDEILADESYNLDNMSLQYPRQAAAIALELYKSRYGNTAAAKRSPYATPKSTMQSTATGVQPGNGKINVEDVNRLQQQLAANPELAFDKDFLAKLQELKQKRIASIKQD